MMFSLPQYSTIAMFTASILCPVQEGLAQEWSQGGPYGNFYKVVKEDGLKWDEARDAAEGETAADGLLGCAHLATITSKRENKFVNRLRRKAGITAMIWLGGYQEKAAAEPNQDWEWVTGEDFLYTNWYAGEPNNHIDEDFLTMGLFNTGKWNDEDDSDITINEYKNVRGYAVEIDNNIPSIAECIIEKCIEGADKRRDFLRCVRRDAKLLNREYHIISNKEHRDIYRTARWYWDNLH